MNSAGHANSIQFWFLLFNSDTSGCLGPASHSLSSRTRHRSYAAGPSRYLALEQEGRIEPYSKTVKRDRFGCLGPASHSLSSRTRHRSYAAGPSRYALEHAAYSDCRSALVRFDRSGCLGTAVDSDETGRA